MILIVILDPPRRRHQNKTILIRRLWNFMLQQTAF